MILTKSRYEIRIRMWLGQVSIFSFRAGQDIFGLKSFLWVLILKPNSKQSTKVSLRRRTTQTKLSVSSSRGATKQDVCCLCARKRLLSKQLSSCTAVNTAEEVQLRLELFEIRPLEPVAL